MNRWRYWPQLCPLHALLQLGQQEESPSQVLWRTNQPDLSLKRIIGRSPQNTTKEETEPFSFSWRTTSQSEQWSYLHLPRSLVCFLLWTVNKLLSESGQGCIFFKKNYLPGDHLQSWSVGASLIKGIIRQYIGAECTRSALARKEFFVSKGIIRQYIGTCCTRSALARKTIF